MMKFNAMGFEIEITAKKEWHDSASDQDTMSFMNALSIILGAAAELHRDTNPSAFALYKADSNEVYSQLKELGFYNRFELNN